MYIAILLKSGECTIILIDSYTNQIFILCKLQYSEFYSNCTT